MASALPTDSTLYGKLLDELRPHWLRVAGCLVLGLLASPIALLAPFPLKIAVDGVLQARPLPPFVHALLPAAMRSEGALLALAAGLLVAVTLLGQAQELAQSLLRTSTGERIVLGFRSRLFDYVQRLSLSHSDAKGTSDAVYRILYDAPAVQYIAIDGAIPFVASAVTVGGMLYVAARIDWRLAVVAFTVTPLLFAVTKVYRSRLRRHSREVKELESSALSVVQEVLGARRVVKAFGREDREQERFVESAGQGMRARVRLVLLEGAFGLVVGLITATGSAAVLYLGVRHVQAGLLTLGDLLLLLGYLAQLYGPLKTMSRKVASLQSHLASAERAFALLDEKPDVIERPGARPLRRASGTFAFRDVSFAYASERLVLRGVSFEVAAGSRVAVVGPTGAGKTTLASLLIRFYDPLSGQILLDGVDLRDYRLRDLRDQFAVVLQDTMLFSTSIAENIAYARPGASEREIVAAAAAAGADDFIARLPGGYEAQVGERGAMLSGGERQRIALARAFLKDAPILILDEPTSALDARTEAAVLEAIERLARQRTTFLISHRPSALGICQTRIELDHGRIAAREGPVRPSPSLPVEGIAPGRLR